MSIQAQLTARPRRRPRALSDRRDQEPLLRPGPCQARRRPYSRSKCFIILVLSKTLCFFFFINCFLIFRMEEKPKPKVPMPGSCLDDPISRSLRGDLGSGDSERKAEPSAPNYSRRFSPAAVEQHQIRMSGTLNCSKVFPSSKYPSKTSLFALEV